MSRRLPPKARLVSGIVFVVFLVLGFAVGVGSRDEPTSGTATPSDAKPSGDKSRQSPVAPEPCQVRGILILPEAEAPLPAPSPSASEEPATGKPSPQVPPDALRSQLEKETGVKTWHVFRFDSPAIRRAANAVEGDSPVVLLLGSGSVTSSKEIRAEAELVTGLSEGGSPLFIARGPWGSIDGQEALADAVAVAEGSFMAEVSKSDWPQLGTDSDTQLDKLQLMEITEWMAGACPTTKKE